MYADSDGTLYSFIAVSAQEDDAVRKAAPSILALTDDGDASTV